MSSGGENRLVGDRSSETQCRPLDMNSFHFYLMMQQLIAEYLAGKPKAAGPRAYCFKGG
jgi:hypothetical protein